MEDVELTAPPNPLLDRIQIPGESFTLPSRALLYTNGEVSDRVKARGEIHIHPMTAIDEIVMRSPDKVLSGDAVVEVFQRCIPDILMPARLLQRDLDFLVAALRKVSYGDEIILPHTHDCEGAESHTYSCQMSSVLQRAKALDPTTIAKRFNVNVDNGQVVHLEPIRYEDVLVLMTNVMENEDALDPVAQEKYLIESLVRVISSIDEVTDKDQIMEWIRAIPVQWAQQISTAIDDTTKWGPEFEFTVECKDCGKNMTFDAPMNPISFFM